MTRHVTRCDALIHGKRARACRHIIDVRTRRLLILDDAYFTDEYVNGGVSTDTACPDTAVLLRAKKRPRDNMH